jgi:hypothetical protein
MAGGDCFPSPRQMLVLRAALCGPPNALAAWEELRGRALLEDEAVSRLLPLLHENLRRAGAAPEQLRGLRGVRRHTLVANEMLFRGVAPVIAALEEAGVRTVLLKGASLALRHYADPGLRPMTDIDLLVAPGDLARAVRIFANHGFLPTVEPTPRRTQLLHAEDFADERGVHVDLHWRLHPHREEADESLWSRLDPLSIAGAPSHALSPADELLHQLVHGLHWSQVSPIRWVADSCGILANPSASVDWGVFTAAAAKGRVVTAVLEGLRFLREEFEAPVPAAVLDALAASPDPFVERLEYRLGIRRSTYTVFGGVPLFAIRYLRESRGRGDLPGPAGFLRYLRELWALDSNAQVWNRIGVRAVARAWSRVSGRPLPPLAQKPRAR